MYHRALVYCLGISEDTRRNAKRIYDFRTGYVQTECLQEGRITSGSAKIVRMAFNLFRYPEYCFYRDREDMYAEN